MNDLTERSLTAQEAYFLHLFDRLPPEKQETYLEMLEIVASLFNGGEHDVDGAIKRLMPLADDIFGPEAADYVTNLREQLGCSAGVP